MLSWLAVIDSRPLLDEALHDGGVGQSTRLNGGSLVFDDFVGKGSHQVERYDGVLGARNADVLAQVGDQTREVGLNNHSVSNLVSECCMCQPLSVPYLDPSASRT